MPYVKTISMSKAMLILFPCQADSSEPNWQQSFFGSNYERLLDIKQRYDPLGVFYALKAVGTEGWEVKTSTGLPTQNGKLCRV